ncbi:MAG: hypothetical protein U5R46_10585 [Gammaproteobacteria bacterium]|nr:hypothetical protein [Gammaproteobacteria bacterium]
MRNGPPTPRVVFTLALLGLVAALAVMTWPIRSTSYLIPAFILVPTAVLLAFQLCRDMRGPRTEPAGDDAAAVVAAFAWLALMPVLLAATGLVFGGALYTLAYLRVRNGDGRVLSLVSAMVVGAGLALVAYGLRMPQLFSGPFG